MWETRVLVLTLPSPDYRIFNKLLLLFGSQFMYLEIKEDLKKLKKAVFGENILQWVHLSVMTDSQNGSWHPFSWTWMKRDNPNSAIQAAATRPSESTCKVKCIPLLVNDLQNAFLFQELMFLCFFDHVAYPSYLKTGLIEWVFFCNFIDSLLLRVSLQVLMKFRSR